MFTFTIRFLFSHINDFHSDTRFHYQEHDHPFASALRTQIEWTSFGAEMNPFARYNPLRPLILWYNNRRIDHYIHAEIDKRFTELKDDYLSNSESRPSKSIISLALRDFMKAKGLEGTSKVNAEFRDIAAAQLRLFLFAGHDTTSSTLIYCYHLLATHPECMAQIRAEHNEVFGINNENTYQKLLETPQLLNQLPYTLAVIKETLRLFPPASGFRAGRSDINIVDDNGKIYPTEGCSVWAMHLIIQRNPKYWKEPNSFNPERWLVGPNHPLYPVKGAWRPFEFGPRNCLGQTLAVMELKVVLAMTIRDFEIQPAYDQWDREHSGSHVRTVIGNRAYQVEGGGGGAHPADRYPCKIAFSA
jgi:cytochrome P450